MHIDFINEMYHTPESKQIDAYQCRVLTDLMEDTVYATLIVGDNKGPVA